MNLPNKQAPSVEIDLWREHQELKRLRRNILGIESYGRDIEELKRNENGATNTSRIL